MRGAERPSLFCADYKTGQNKDFSSLLRFGEQDITIREMSILRIVVDFFLRIGYN